MRAPTGRPHRAARLPSGRALAGAAGSAAAGASQPVSGSGHRFDDARLAELAAELHHRHADGGGERVDVGIPDALEKLLGRDGGAVGRQQDMQDAELLGREPELPARAAGAAAGGIELQVPVAQDRRASPTG